MGVQHSDLILLCIINCSPCKVYLQSVTIQVITVLLSIFLCCTSHHCDFSVFDWKLIPLNLPHHFTYPPITLPSGNHSFVFYVCASVLLCSFLFEFLGSTYSWNHMIVFLCPTYFTWHNTLQVRPHCCRWLNFILFMAK